MPTIPTIDRNNLPYWMTQGNPYGTAPIDFRTLSLNPTATGVGAAPGTLAGAPGTGGSVAAGQRPAVPDPGATQAGALAGNLANLAKLRQLFNKTSQTVGIGPGMMQAETANINNLLNPPSQFVDIDRMTAEAGSAGLGGAGSPASFTRGYRMTDEEMLRRRLLGTSLLNQRADRANAILSPQQFMIRPEAQQAWQNLANMVAAAPDPEAAFRRALGLAQSGINRGFGAGYGGGAPRVGAPMGPGATYAGDVNWNNLTAARAAVPTWPTLPSFQGGGAPSAFAPPPSNAGEDFLSSLGLGLGQPGVTTAPTLRGQGLGPGYLPGVPNFIGDVNVPEDLYG